MDIRFNNRWQGFSLEELERFLWMLEYYVNQDDLTFDLTAEVTKEIKNREKYNEKRDSI